MAMHKREMSAWREGYYRRWRNELAARRPAGGSVVPPDGGSVVPPELSGVRIRLRPLEPGNELQLYQWASDEQEYWLWREEPGVIGFDSFCEQLRRALLANEPHFAVESLHSRRMVGWVYADQLSSAHRRCRMHIYVVPQARSYGAGAEAGIFFLDYLFGWLDMRKVIAEALVAQHGARRMAEYWGFEVEGIFREERWLGCRTHDVVRLAIQREIWRQRYIDALGTARTTSSSGAHNMPHFRNAFQQHELFFPGADQPQHL